MLAKRLKTILRKQKWIMNAVCSFIIPLFTDCKQILKPNSRLQLTVRKLVYVVMLMVIEDE